METFQTSFLLSFLLAFAIIRIASFAVQILDIVASWMLFEKAGEHGWSAIIPVYNFIVKCKIAFGSYKQAEVYIAICAALVFLLAVIACIAPMLNVPESVNYILFAVVMMCYLGLLVILGIQNYHFGKVFGKSKAWNICMIFFAPVMIAIMGFSKNTVYVGHKSQQ